MVDQQSFSAAARRLGVAASSVTRRIDRLETQLGIRLLHRTTHALRPTEAGQLLYGRATRMLAELRGLQEDLHSQHDEPSGLLRVDCPAPFGRRHLMAALAAFMQRHPALQVDLVLTDSMVDLQGARLGSDVDLAARIGPLEDTRFVATVLAPQRRVLCASAAYLARRGEPESPDALAGHDCLAWHGAPPPGAWRFGERRHVPAQPRFRSNHSEALLEAAIDGSVSRTCRPGSRATRCATGACARCCRGSRRHRSRRRSTCCASRRAAPRARRGSSRFSRRGSRSRHGMPRGHDGGRVPVPKERASHARPVKSEKPVRRPAAAGCAAPTGGAPLLRHYLARLEDAQ